MKELSFSHKLTKNLPLILKMRKSATLYFSFYPASRFSDYQNNCPELARVSRLKKVKTRHYKCNADVLFCFPTVMLPDSYVT